MKAKIMVLQIPVHEEKSKNIEYLNQYIEIAVKEKADMLILPEMFLCPYQTENFPKYAEPEGGQSWQAFSRIARENHIYFCAGSVPELDEGGKVYNTAYVFDREGRQIAKHRKVHLFDIAVAGGQCFKESDTLSPGNSITVFDTDFGKMGLCICYDMRFPELSRLMALEGAKVIIVPAAFNMTTGPAHWEVMFRSRAVDNQVYTIGAAPSRQEGAGYISWGHSLIVSPWGDIICGLDEKEGYLIQEIDIERTEEIREQLPLLKHRRKDIYSVEKL